MESLPVPKKQKCLFQAEWLHFSEFKNWLRWVKEGLNAANMSSCVLCDSLLHVRYRIPSATDFVPSPTMYQLFTQDMYHHKN